MLYIVATPIGNLADITLRSIEILKQVDTVICEDSRRTSILLNHYQIKKPMLILNDFNEARVMLTLIEQLKSGVNMALVSDAGTPLVSDPGFKLVRECIEQKIPVDSIPGPSSVITALTLSGLPPDKFFFLGYLPEKPGQRKNMLQKLSTINETIKTTFIIFVAPHKLIKTLEDIKNTLGDIEVALAHELTKTHQSVEKQTPQVWIETFNQHPPKGEYIMLIHL